MKPIILIGFVLTGCLTPGTPPKPCSSYSTEELQLRCEEVRAKHRAAVGSNDHSVGEYGAQMFGGKKPGTSRCVSKKNFDGSVTTDCE